MHFSHLENNLITASELREARLKVVRMVQGDHFAQLKKDLVDRRICSPSSELRRLQPQVDAEGVIRVGGRLQNAHLSEDEKHLTIIPKNSHLAELVIRDAHLRTLHGGPELIQSFICRTFWIMHARNRIRRLTRQCVRRTRFQGHNQLQQMAPLPAERVTPSRPSAATGLDYARPF